MGKITKENCNHITDEGWFCANCINEDFANQLEKKDRKIKKLKKKVRKLEEAVIILNNLIPNKA